MAGETPVREAYAAWAATYDDDRNATRDLDAAVLREAGLPLAGATVVEIGAGTGKNTAHLAVDARQVVALDLSPEMLAHARRRNLGPHVRFVEHDIRRPWPVEDGTADLVVGNLVLEHVQDVGPIFAEAFRALRAGGLFYLSELHPYRQLRGAGAKFAGREGEERVEAYRHTTAAYVAAALDAGFRLRRLTEPGDRPEGRREEALPRLLVLLSERP
jgi:SAM-dependent methyltransferase